MDTSQLFEIVSKGFEHGRSLNDYAPYQSAQNSASNPVMFRLLGNISELKKQGQNDELIDAIIADIHLSHTMGWLQQDAHDKALKILEEN